MKKVLLVVFLLALGVLAGSSQGLPTESPGWFNRFGRWSLTLQGAGNMWLNDFNTKDISGGGTMALRYAVSRNISLGIIGGYDALMSKNNANANPADPIFKHTYVEGKGYSGDVALWWHFNAGKPLSPYVYGGVGGFLYKRKVEGNAYWSENKMYSSIHIPFGLGLDMAMGKNVGLNAEIGGRLLDHWSDNTIAGKQNLFGTDWFPTAKLGLAFFLGSSPDDDNDGDGLTNGNEETYGTDRNLADSDGDGLSDFEEVTKTKTDPKKADTDGDGLSDGDEVIKYHTDPLKADTDGDGLSDGDEVMKYHTDPLKADTDGDGLKDGEEVMTYHTDPLKADTDGDGLSDGDEVTKYHTDPLKADTDGGSVNDGAEVARGSNPLDPADDVPKPTIKIEVGKAIVLEGIVFKSGKSTIDPASENTLTQAFNALNDNPAIAVEIRGYTDNVGKIAANKKLSLARATAVKSWLVKKGVDSTRISVKGYGPENPISDNGTADGRAKNRRIEFYRTK